MCPKPSAAETLAIRQLDRERLYGVFFGATQIAKIDLDANSDCQACLRTSVRDVLRALHPEPASSAIKSLIATDFPHGADAPWLDAGSSPA